MVPWILFLLDISPIPHCGEVLVFELQKYNMACMPIDA